MRSKQLPNKKRWKREIVRGRGPEAGMVLLAQIQTRYDELLGETRRYENKALQHHFDDNLLPVVAAYSILLMDGQDRKTAAQTIDLLLEAAIEPERRMYRFLGRLPFFFDMIKLMLKPMMKMQYPEKWNVEWLELGPDIAGLNCHSCFYLDVLTEYGFPELTPHFCRLDDLLASEAAPSVRFERTQTMGRGGTLCDFRYMRAKAN